MNLDIISSSTLLYLYLYMDVLLYKWVNTNSEITIFLFLVPKYITKHTIIKVCISSGIYTIHNNIHVMIIVKFQRKNCGAKVIRLVIKGEEVVEDPAEKEGDVRRAVVIAEARLISTKMSSSSMLSVFLIIEILCVSQTWDSEVYERERKGRCDLFSSLLIWPLMLFKHMNCSLYVHVL